MPDDTPPLAVPPEVKVATVESDPLVLFTTPQPLDPVRVVQGLRYLQQQIVNGEPLSVREARSKLRVANLDPVFLDTGVQAIDAGGEPDAAVGMTAEEISVERALARQWDDVQREIRVLSKAIDASNLRRKWRIGTAVLTMYYLLRRGSRPHLSAYLDEMKRAYMRTRKKSRKGATDDEGAAE